MGHLTPLMDYAWKKPDLMGIIDENSHQQRFRLMDELARFLIIFLTVRPHNH
jgi:hypothetical protein